MAKIQEEIIVIKLSKLAKDNDELQKIVNSDLVGALEQVVQELVENSVIVEVENQL